MFELAPSKSPLCPDNLTHLGFKVTQQEHPQTNQLVDCLNIRIPSPKDLSYLTLNGRPSHYTPKKIDIMGTNLNSPDFKIHHLNLTDQTIKTDKNLIGLTPQPKIATLPPGTYQIRIEDANPPKNCPGKTLYYLIESPSHETLISAIKTRWTEALVSVDPKKQPSFHFTGSQIHIFTDHIYEIICPWDLEPVLKHHYNPHPIRKKIIQNYQKWLNLQQQIAYLKAQQANQKLK